ncbi:alkaline phosphatase [Pilimelia terevasa]|uniref:Alkaline phosphatase n=1 Tax=Pilimelia terevasa TaxID=53372 RepID=A0A8J3FIL1_9ACTN|nr:alkaline phosphatase D family protein [Pilimelia terevasa]GGK19605.1 alkaline phosphatase [Pilimelia terevasa]
MGPIPRPPERGRPTGGAPATAPLARRTLLAGTAAGLVAAGALGGAASARVGGPGDRTAARGQRRLRADPFTLGVASGEPAPGGVVLWTRLAVAPLADDGLGGMPDRPVEVAWVLAHDAALSQVVRRGTAAALPAEAHSVHVEVDGLAPGREYHYRFTADGYASAVGRTRTAPAGGARVGRLRLGLVSCAMYEHGLFTAYRHLAAADPDLVVHLGDYQYEHAPGGYPVPGGAVRAHVGDQARTLAQYRQRYAQYHADPDLQAAHAAAPWLVVFDDHEVVDNWAADVPGKPDPHFADRRAAAMRAYWENMPLRRSARPSGVALPLHRRLHWGDLATLHLLDTRQYRDDQGCGDGYRECAAAADPARTLTGAAQERWLLDGFRASSARWDLLAQQVFFGRRDRDPGPKLVTSQDAWDGYLGSRDRITRGWVAAGVRNPVVLTGDVHAHWAGDLVLDYADPAAPAVGAEIVCSSVASGGDGHDGDPAGHPFMAQNPHLRFYNNQRGFVLATLDPRELEADFQVVPKVSGPGAPAYSRARFAAADRERGLHATYLRPLDPALARAATAEETVAAETAG